MSFYKDYPNRKDWRGKCRKGCRGECDWCESNRTHKNIKRQKIADEKLKEYKKEHRM